MTNVKASSMPAEQTGSVSSSLPALSLPVQLGEGTGQKTTRQNKIAGGLMSL